MIAGPLTLAPAPPRVCMASVLRSGVCLLRNLYYMGESRPQLGARGRLTYIRSTTLPAHAPPFAGLIPTITSTQKTNCCYVRTWGAWPWEAASLWRQASTDHCTDDFDAAASEQRGPRPRCRRCGWTCTWDVLLRVKGAAAQHLLASLAH